MFIETNQFLKNLFKQAIRNFEAVRNFEKCETKNQIPSKLMD